MTHRAVAWQAIRADRRATIAWRRAIESDDPQGVRTNTLLDIARVSAPGESTMSTLSKAIRVYREAYAENTEARAAMSARLKAREATKGTHAYQEASQRHTIAVAEVTRAKQAADRAWYDFTAGALAEDRGLPQLHLRYRQAAQALERAFSEQQGANRALAVFDAWTDEDARCAERSIESRRAVEAAIATLKMAALAVHSLSLIFF